MCGRRTRSSPTKHAATWEWHKMKWERKERKRAHDYFEVAIDLNTWKLHYQYDLYLKEVLFHILIPSFSSPPPTCSPYPPTAVLSHSLYPLCSPRALETEWSECEPTIVEINGIWSTGYKEWQSLDSKWAKRVVRTWAVLVVRKGWRERERDGAMEGRKEATGCLF